MKDLHFVGTTLEDLRAFPAPARRVAGYQLSQVQQGLEPDDWRPMPSVGPGVIEIRLHEEGEFRVFYIAKLADVIHVLHAFQKKTRETAKKDIDLAKARLKQIRGSRP